MEQESAEIRRLKAIDRAIRERIDRLESRARLPRGTTIGAVRDELALLEAESVRIGREIVQHVAAVLDLARERRALAQGGVEIGGRIPAGRNPFESVDDSEPSSSDGGNV